MSVIKNENGTYDVYDDYWWHVLKKNIPSKEEAIDFEKKHTTPLTDKERFILRVLK